MKFAITPAAQADLVQIFELLDEENPRAAKRVLTELRQAMRRLARLPGMGHLRDDLADEPLRFWPVRSYLVIYRPGPPIQVLRVLHAARDVRALLEAD